MSLVVIAIASGLVVGLLLGRSVRALARARLRAGGLLLAGAACELVSNWVSGPAGGGILITGYVLLIAFAVRNLATAGMVLVAVGLLANLTVISVDGGMPVRGLPATSTYGWRHHGERPGDHLTGLADVVRLSPLGETVSAGDIVLSLGVATVVVSLMRPARRATSRRVTSVTS
jgi:hypothetical protein